MLLMWLLLGLLMPALLPSPLPLPPAPTKPLPVPLSQQFRNKGKKLETYHQLPPDPSAPPV